MNNSRGFSAIEIFLFLLVLLLLCWCSLCDNPLNNAQAQKISGPVFAPDQGLPHGRVLQKKDHDKAVRGDTVLIGPGAIAVSHGNGRFKATIGGAASNVIQKGDTFRIAKHRPQSEVSGIFEQVINEDIITRASDEAPNYKVSSGGKYVQFLFMGGTDPARLNATIGNGWRWDYNNYAVEIAVSTGVVKETLTTERGAPTEYWWAIDTNEPKTLNGFGSFSIPKVTAKDARNDTVPVTEAYTWDNGWKFTINVDTSGVAFPITIDPSVILKDTSTIADADVRSSSATTNFGTATELELDGGGGFNFHLFMKFTLTSIPVYAIIDSVLDSLKMGGTYTGTIVNPVKMALVTGTWAENTITWNTRPTVDSTGSIVDWVMPTTGTGWARISPDSGAVYDTLKNWVQNWVDGSVTNNGYVLRMLPQDLTDRTRRGNLPSSENATAANRPSRTIYYTLVYTPTTPTVDSVESSIRAILNGGSNPDSFSIFLYDSTDQRWIDSLGAKQVSPQALTIGDTITMTYMNRDVWHKYATKAVSPGGDTSALSGLDSSKVVSPWDSIKAYASGTNKVIIHVDADTLTGADTVFTLIWDPVDNDTVARDTLVFTAALHKDTLTLPDSLNKKWRMRGVVKTSASLRYNSALDSFRTFSVKPASISWTWANDTSGVLVATKHSTMPNNSGYFLVDSTFVSAGSTKVYLHPDSLGYFATKTYRSITSFNDTIKFPDADLIAGASIKFSLHAGNVDSTGAQ